MKICVTITSAYALQSSSIVQLALRHSLSGRDEDPLFQLAGMLWCRAVLLRAQGARCYLQQFQIVPTYYPHSGMGSRSLLLRQSFQCLLLRPARCYHFLDSTKPADAKRGGHLLLESMRNVRLSFSCP